MAHDVSIKAFQKYLKGVSSKNTALKYGSYAQRFLGLMHENGYHTFSAMPSGFLSEWSALLSQEGNSGSTVRVHIFAVKRYLDWVEGKDVAVTKQTKVDLPKKQIRIRPSLPQDRFSDFFQQADIALVEPVRSAVMLLPCSGLRASEMVSLKLENIHRATIPLEKGPKGEKREKATLFLRVTGKGGKERNVPLMEEGVEILTGYLAGFRRRNKAGPWLFPRVTTTHATTGRKHISDTYLRTALRDLREVLGIELMTPHTMRRTYITTLYRRGVDLGALANIAGHANVQTTLDHYINIDADQNIRKVHAAGSSLTG